VNGFGRQKIKVNNVDGDYSGQLTIITAFVKTFKVYLAPIIKTPLFHVFLVAELNFNVHLRSVR
jgi:hypothetical protein